jgi:hypothetical protein
VDFPGLARGTYRVLGFADDARAAAGPVRVAAGIEAAVRLTGWSPGAGPTGIVRDAAGEPAAGALVVLRHDPSADGGVSLLALTRADGDGRFRLPALPMLDDLALVVRHGRTLYAPVPLVWREEGRRLDIGLRGD